MAERYFKKCHGILTLKVFVKCVCHASSCACRAVVGAQPWYALGISEGASAGSYGCEYESVRQ